MKLPTWPLMKDVVPTDLLDISPSRWASPALRSSNSTTLYLSRRSHSALNSSARRLPLSAWRMRVKGSGALLSKQKSFCITPNPISLCTITQHTLPKYTRAHIMHSTYVHTSGNGVLLHQRTHSVMPSNPTTLHTKTQYILFVYTYIHTHTFVRTYTHISTYFRGIVVVKVYSFLLWDHFLLRPQIVPKG